MGPLLQSELWEVEGAVAIDGGEYLGDRLGEERGVVLRSEYVGREDGELCGTTGELARDRVSSLGYAGFRMIVRTDCACASGALMTNKAN